jgi:hypothetical protein
LVDHTWSKRHSTTLVSAWATAAKWGWLHPRVGIVLPSDASITPFRRNDQTSALGLQCVERTAPSKPSQFLVKYTPNDCTPQIPKTAHKQPTVSKPNLASAAICGRLYLVAVVSLGAWPSVQACSAAAVLGPREPCEPIGGGAAVKGLNCSVQVNQEGNQSHPSAPARLVCCHRLILIPNHPHPTDFHFRDSRTAAERFWHACPRRTT